MIPCKNRSLRKASGSNLDSTAKKEGITVGMNTKNKNEYSEYEIVEATLDEFRECVSAIAEMPDYYYDNLDDLWEIIQFMLTDETFGDLFPEDIYEFIDQTIRDAGLSLQNNYHRIFDAYRKDQF